MADAQNVTLEFRSKAAAKAFLDAVFPDWAKEYSDKYDGVISVGEGDNQRDLPIKLDSAHGMRERRARRGSSLYMARSMEFE